MTWFKVDDALATHDKVLAAGNAAMGLWVRAGAWSAQHLTDGDVPMHAVKLLGTKRQADDLVRAGLWVTTSIGYRFHEWSDYQPTREHVEQVREERRKAGAKGGKRSGESRSKGEANVKQVGSTLSNPRPGPTRPVSLVTTPNHSSTRRVTPGLEGHELQKIALATGGDMGHAEKVARQVLATASGDVRAPLSYILAAIRQRPEDHRFRRGNPTKATACPQHPGEWADNCRIHASEGA